MGRCALMPPFKNSIWLFVKRPNIWNSAKKVFDGQMCSLAPFEKSICFYLEEWIADIQLRRFLMGRCIHLHASPLKCPFKSPPNNRCVPADYLWLPRVLLYTLLWKDHFWFPRMAVNQPKRLWSLHACLPSRINSFEGSHGDCIKLIKMMACVPNKAKKVNYNSGMHSAEAALSPSKKMACVPSTVA